MVKKNRTCERCGYTCATPQKLREHLKRKNPCRPQNFVPVQAPMAEPEIITSSTNMQGNFSRNETPFLESLSHTEPFPVKYPNDRKPGETVKQWGSRLRKRYKEICYENYEQPRTLRACQVLYDTLLQIDEEAYDCIEPIKQTIEEQELQPVVEPAKSQVVDSPKAGSSSKIPLEIDQTNEEFERLSMITGEHEKNLVFREQQLGPALKRRAVAMHNANVPRYHPDNGSDIRKMLESHHFGKYLKKNLISEGNSNLHYALLQNF